MSEIQDLAQAFFGGVFPDYVVFDPDGVVDQLPGFFHRKIGRGGQFFPMGAATDESVFDHFGKAGEYFALGQGRQKGGMDHDHFRQGEKPDDVFDPPQIDPRFPAYRGVHLGQ